MEKANVQGTFCSRCAGKRPVTSVRSKALTFLSLEQLEMVTALLRGCHPGVGATCHHPSSRCLHQLTGPWQVASPEQHPQLHPTCLLWPVHTRRFQARPAHLHAGSWLWLVETRISLECETPSSLACCASWAISVQVFFAAVEQGWEAKVIHPPGPPKALVGATLACETATNSCVAYAAPLRRPPTVVIAP